MIKLQTRRLILSELTTQNAPFILQLYNDPNFIKYIGKKNINNIRDAERFIDSSLKQSYKLYNHGLYLVQLKDSTSIGICGLLQRKYLNRPDIGFAALPDFRRMGFIYEASKATIQDAKVRLCLDKISAITSPDNNASIRLLMKLGFKFKKMISVNSNSEPTQLYSLHLDS